MTEKEFYKSKSNIPTTNSNVSVIAPYDFDNDGDIDVSIGSRSVPGVYGLIQSICCWKIGKETLNNIEKWHSN
jgi:hypothetical protein